ncbi:MAG: dUTP diphosphatase [Candidatus Asgardarchaeum californiense]|nr:MAG: dUTP diphosphatase [Candidatus Asgardarchaeum californiense]
MERKDKIVLTRGFEYVDSKYLKSYSACDEVILPLRGTDMSAGYDFFMPYEILIEPQDSVFFWTDVRAYMLDGEVLELYPRSSTGGKRNICLKNTVGIIDADYYGNEKTGGNIGLFLRNFGTTAQRFEKGEALVQGIFKQFLVSDNCNNNVKRTGGIGSTSFKIVK